MKTFRQALGRWGESLAADYLIKKNYEIVERNVHTPYGEIDLVARQGRVTVFVEVKTRTSKNYGYPEDAVTPSKQAHLVAAAQYYLMKQPELDGDWRVDVIAVQRLRSGQQPQIVHFENAIR
jgi:putative endonuclease